MKQEYNTFSGKAYRYISYDGFKKTIENEVLRFTRIDNFNDPLDCSPYLAPFEWGNYNFNSGLTKEIKDHFFAPYHNSFFICCFSKNYDTQGSYLMWSHYANGHSQLCFELDFSNYNSLGIPFEVNYPDDISLCREKLKIKKTCEENDFLFVITSKLKQWSYEEEIRLIIDINIKNKLTESLKYDESDKYIYAPIDLNKISKVTFGVNSKKEEEEIIIRILQEKKNNAVFEKMILDPVTLKIKPIKYEFY